MIRLTSQRNGEPIYFDIKNKPSRIVPQGNYTTIVFQVNGWMGKDETYHDVKENSQDVYRLFEGE